MLNFMRRTFISMIRHGCISMNCQRISRSETITWIISFSIEVKRIFPDDEHTYFLNIIDFNLKDEAPPVEFLSDRIKEIIVMDRLQELKEKNETSLIRSIKSKHEININI